MVYIADACVATVFYRDPPNVRCPCAAVCAEGRQNRRRTTVHWDLGSMDGSSVRSKSQQSTVTLDDPTMDEDVTLTDTTTMDDNGLLKPPKPVHRGVPCRLFTGCLLDALSPMLYSGSTWQTVSHQMLALGLAHRIDDCRKVGCFCLDNPRNPGPTRLLASQTPEEKFLHMCKMHMPRVTAVLRC